MSRPSSSCSRETRSGTTRRCPHGIPPTCHGLLIARRASLPDAAEVSSIQSMIRKKPAPHLMRGWKPVFPRDKREAFARTSCSSKKTPEASSTQLNKTLERFAVGFAGADPQGVIDRRYEDLAVADLSGACAGGDDLHRLVGEIGGDGDFDPQLRQKIHDIFGAAIDLGVAFLEAVTLDLC